LAGSFVHFVAKIVANLQVVDLQRKQTACKAVRSGSIPIPASVIHQFGSSKVRDEKSHMKLLGVRSIFAIVIGDTCEYS